MDFISRLKTEQIELSEKINKLESFVKSENWENVDVEQKVLLAMQLDAMTNYNDILIKRLSLL